MKISKTQKLSKLKYTLPSTEKDLNLYEKKVYTTLRQYRNKIATDLCWQGFRVMKNLPILQLVRHVRKNPKFTANSLVSKCLNIGSRDATPYKTARNMLRMLKTDPELIQNLKYSRKKPRILIF
jgi:hypothetical protein